MKYVTVANMNVAVVEYNNERVLTTEQVGEGFECEPKQIKQNFNNNKERFVEGKHFYKLEGEELRSFKHSVENFDLVGKNANILYLWTKRGVARHSKMLGTDRAWDMFDQLEETYFTVHQKQLSPIELIAAQANALVEQERKIQAIQAKQEQQSQELQGMRDVIQLSSVSWRKETTALINKMAVKAGDLSKVRDFRRESYMLLDERMGVSVEIRLKNARKNMYEAGYSKTQIEKLNALDVIERDKKLVEGYLAVVKDMAIKYGVA